jgi:release factor glutamine methyltransferase
VPVRPDVSAGGGAGGWVVAADAAALLVEAASTEGALAALVERRVGGEPLEYILGWALFCGLRVAVDPGVFVPRQRSELLVEQAAVLAPDGAIAVDLCCGSGALGVALMHARPVELHAADLDPAAVRCARRNVEPMGGQVYEGDLFDPLPPVLRGRVQVVVANVPYVPTDAIGSMPPEARLYEAAVALDGGRDGLDVLRRVATGASAWLAPGGHLLVETSEQQAPAAVQAVAECGLAGRVVADHDRAATVVVARLPPSH